MARAEAKAAGTVAEVARWQGCTREKAMEGRLNELVARDPSPNGRRIVTKLRATRGSRNSGFGKRGDGLKGVHSNTTEVVYVYGGCLRYGVRRALRIRIRMRRGQHQKW